jgi:hypothetical protein
LDKNPPFTDDERTFLRELEYVIKASTQNQQLIHIITSLKKKLKEYSMNKLFINAIRDMFAKSKVNYGEIDDLLSTFVTANV